ncbi:MAG: aminopeptidase [Anaerohalosphaeraceae bacterium]|nr:aminopeptidase [Anaerohalosphaeraceae bacterium]
MAVNDVYKKYARVLVKYSLKLGKGDKFLIRSSYLAEELIKEIYRVALEAGAHPEVRISLNGAEKIFYDTATNAQLGYVSPSSLHAIKNYNALVNISAPFNLKELQNIDPAKKQKVSIARTKLNNIFMKRAAAGALRWNLCVFPTDSAAQECGMSLSEYKDFVYSACFLNHKNPVAKWRQLHDKQQKVVNYLNKRKKIEFKSNDVDITFSTVERKWINSSGKNNMPSGEVFTTPVENSVNGKIRFSYPGFFMGQEIEDITLEVKDGKVVKWSAKKGAKLLDKVFEIPGTRRFGEAAVGMNYGIKKFTKNTLFDEKIGGTIHMAVGAAYPETGGKNKSSVHWDLIADMSRGGQIFADGKKIYSKGKFIIG